MSGAELPVVPMCRVQHYWKCAEPLEPLPLIKDESGMFFRPEGAGFAGGRPSFDIQPGFVDDIHSGYFANYFEDTVWPLMANLVPKFECLQLQRSWAGHYAQNQFDQHHHRLWVHRARDYARAGGWSRTERSDAERYLPKHRLSANGI